MKIISKLALLIFSLWLPSSFADCPQNSYALYCRGGGGFTLKIPGDSGSPVIVSDIIGKFFKNKYPYSQRGRGGISPGSCAWYDRVINEGEPSEFHFEVRFNVVASQLGMNLLSQCAPSNICWMSFCAKNTGTGFITILSGAEMSATFNPK